MSALPFQVSIWWLDIHVCLSERLLSMENRSLDNHSYRPLYFIAVFCDYLLVTGNDLVQIENVKQSVAKRFALTDEGKLGVLFRKCT